MTAEIGRAAALGQVGIWRHLGVLRPGLGADLERLGFGALWIGGSPPEDLRAAEEVLDASTRIVVATGVVNIWRADPLRTAASYHRIVARHPGRFLLGVGVGHPEAAGARYQRPVAALVEYLDALDGAGVPREAVVLAALGPTMLRIAGGRTAGAHPYLTTPDHTRLARELLDTGPLLAPEQHVVLDEDPRSARALAREAVAPYLGMVNYTNNFRRFGFGDEDLADGGSDALIDALVASGSAETVAGRLREHLDAGADHVCLQLLTPDGADPLEGYRRLAEALGT